MKRKILVLLIIFPILTNAQWVQVSIGMGNRTVWSLTSSENNIFAGTNDSGVYFSTNNGLSWTQTALNNQTIWSLALSGNNVFAGTSFNGVYHSTNNGLNWNQTSLNNKTIYSLIINGNSIFAGTNDYGVYLSTNNGLNWNQTSLYNQVVWSLASSGNNIFAGTSSNGVYLSTDNGLSWTQTSLNNLFIFSLTISGNYIFAGTDYGVYFSTNNGLSWAQTFLNNHWINSLAVNENNVFAGTYYGVYLSTNNGTNWLQRNEGFPVDISIESFCIINNYIIAGTDYNSVWRRYLPELVGVKKKSNSTPSNIQLFQNYPNPFNPYSKIKMQIAKLGEVQLKIYDILGRVVATLVNEKLQPGTYEVEFDGSNYPSGIYFYTLKTENFIETKKLILLK